MAVYNDYPYSNMHEINLDWIIEKVVNAELEINEAIDKINQALDKFQELSDKVDGMEEQVNQAVIDSRNALEKANDALSSLQSTREEIAVLARLVSMTSDRADQAIETANNADEKANQVMEGLRDVVEVQIPIISRVATNAMDTATQAEAKADNANATAQQADDKADEAINKSPVIIDVATTPWYDIYDATTTRKTVVINGLRTVLGLGRDQKLIPIAYEYQNIASRTEFVFISYSQGTFNNIFPKLFIVYARQDYQQASGPAVWSLANSVTLQKELISGTNIKTVNNLSLLGNGNIDIPGSLPELELGTSVQIGTYKEGANRYKVFQKVIDLGSLPDSGSKTIAHGIDKTKVLKYLSIQGTASQANFGNTLPLPCVTLGSESVNNNIYVAVGGNNITISTGSNRTAYTGTLTITYIDNEPLP